MTKLFDNYGLASRGLAPRPSDRIDVRVLAAGTMERHQIPTDRKYGFVVFSGTDHFYARFGDAAVTAAVPSADVTDGSGSELNPAARQIPEGATHIALVAPAAVTVTLAFYEG